MGVFITWKSENATNEGLDFCFVHCTLALRKWWRKCTLNLKKKKGKKKECYVYSPNILISSSEMMSIFITPKKWKKYACSTWKLLPDSERSCLNHWLICQVVTLLHGLTFFLLINIKENINHHSSRNYTLLLQL